MTTNQYRHPAEADARTKEKGTTPFESAPQANQTAADSSIPTIYCFVDDLIACGENGGMSACHLDEATFIAAMLEWKARKEAEYRAKFAYWEFKRQLLRGDM